MCSVTSHLFEEGINVRISNILQMNSTDNSTSFATPNHCLAFFAILHLITPNRLLLQMSFSSAINWD